MKYLTLIIAIFIASLSTTLASQWEIDKSHTKISFFVTHMMLSEVEGQFQKYDGELIAEKDDFSDLKIDLSIDVASINTDNQQRDKHLRSADFFDVDKFPGINFKSTSMKKTGKGKFKLIGDFTMLGVTKSITLEVSHTGTIKDPYGKTRAGFKLIGTIDRTKWGLKYNSVMDSGGLVLSENVDLVCHVELVKKDIVD